VMAFRKHVDGLNCHTQTPTWGSKKRIG
jgi:hypothetical protein